jgi:ABC-2 type transport system ATP-binding protein
VSALLEVRNITKRYGGAAALDGVSFSLEPGAPIGLVGRNGAGKTTLLCIISGALLPDSGTVLLSGKDIRQRPPIGRIAMQPQEAGFRRGVAIGRQLLHFCRLQGMVAAEASDEVARLGRDFGSTGHLNRPIEQLSHGQGKRLNLLQALLGQPQIVLLDEPTAGLDPFAADDLRELIRARARQATFLISSHNLHELQDICTRVLVLDHGRLVSDIDTSEARRSSNTLHFVLDREPGERLLVLLRELPETTDLTSDPHDGTRLALHHSAGDPDRFQLKVQSMIIEHGCSVMHLERGGSLNDAMRRGLPGDQAR